MKRIILFLVMGLNLLVVFFLLVSYLSVFIPPDKFWFPALFGLAYPFIFLINLFFILFWLLIKPKYMYVSLLGILLGVGVLGNHFQISGKEVEAGDIKVLSYNVMHFNGNGIDEQTQTADKITEFLNDQNADIICLQEVRIRRNSIFNPAQTVEDLESINHYQYARSSTTYGSLTMTRYPIVNMGEIRIENSRNISIYTDVLIDNDTVRIFNIHLQSYQIDPNLYSLLETEETGEGVEMNEVREVQTKFKDAYALRAEQVREIARHIEESPYYVIVCGDFNDPPASYSYRKITKGLNDAFVLSGKGVGRTYVGELPSFRIDYILHSSGFSSYNFETLDYHNSDHLPVACLLIKE